ncbi:MAG TPA: phosphatase [Mycobacteriales bacterium]|nr:phosphatase [Mycobacteriales bacterium]
MPTRDQLHDHLETHLITGDVATGRDSNTANIVRMLERETNYDFGLTLSDGWNYESVLALMADRVGIDPDVSRTEGSDTIRTDRCLDALDRMADVIAAVAGRRGSVLLATGHPTGLLVVHQAIARALRAAGCQVVTAGDERPVPIENRPVKVLYVPDVAVLATRAHLLHTHRPEPMRTVLALLDAPPDLVIADHGWAGAAGEAGLSTVGFADCNDPALFVGEADGKVDVVVPLDDNVTPAFYAPMTAYLLRHV